MRSGAFPLVSIVTPVYNNCEHIAECIESILGQSYQNWDYTIVDNCSTDGSLEIAQRYARRDRRIKILRNERFLRAISNHNVALRQISESSKYCKMVFADDWIFPNCLEQMVTVAEEFRSTSMIGAYGLQGHEVMWAGLPYVRRAFSGREVCRRLFLEGLYVFGTATSVLYRADLVRKRDSFYNESNLHADMEAGVQLLRTGDFGFVHQVLTFKRRRPESLGAFTEDINTLIAGHLHCLVTYGRDFLAPTEYEYCLAKRIAEYYNFLGISFARGRRDAEFWKYHKMKLSEAGVGFSAIRLAGAMMSRLTRALFNPYETVEKLAKWKDSAATRDRLSDEVSSSPKSP